MKTRSILFWLSIIAIAPLSIYTKNSNISTPISLQIIKSISIKSVFDQSRPIHGSFSFTNQLFGCLYRMLTCDETKWKSPLIGKYGVELVLTVDQKGCGTFHTLQNAVDAVPDNALKPTLIIVDEGIYREKVNVKQTKSKLIIQGMGKTNTFIVWNDTATTSNGTVHSYSVGVYAPNFIAYDISFKNTAPVPIQGTDGGQAIAFRIDGDKAAFYSCGFYGYQDTLFDSLGRHYFKDCFIQGSIDFIFGNARSLYENCTLDSVASGVGINGAIAAHKRASLSENTGFSFVNCIIQGQGNISLGRAWGVYSTTVYIKTSMSAIITPGGWDDWQDPSRDDKVIFGEHACLGPGADFTNRVKYAKQLSVADATPFMSKTYIDGDTWLYP